MFDLEQLNLLKDKRVLSKAKKYRNEEGEVMVRFNVKQFDNITGEKIQDGLLELSLSELREDKLRCKNRIIKINDILKSIKVALG